MPTGSFDPKATATKKDEREKYFNLTVVVTAGPSKPSQRQEDEMIHMTPKSYTSSFLFLLRTLVLWSLGLTAVSGLTLVRDDRIYQYVGQSNQLDEASYLRNRNVSESEKLDFESVIPEPIR